MRDFDVQVKQMLHEQAAGVPTRNEVPPGLIARTRLRIVMNTLSASVAGAMLIVFAVAIVRGLAPQPEGSIVDPAAPTAECVASQLSAVASFKGAADSREGAILLANTFDRTCTLEGRPEIMLHDKIDYRAFTITFLAAAPRWKLEERPEPKGWPTVTLAPRDLALVGIRWSNWCASPPVPLWSVNLDGGFVDVSGSDSLAPPPCRRNQRPTIEVGPFEPNGG